MKFIDLFAGLGGFHLALQRLGHECVYACEIDRDLRVLYEKNFGLVPHGDIRDVSPEDVPSHDILCAGFPCQPYSKAGTQQGFDCPKWGDLFLDFVKPIIQHHQPQFLLLENVPNLESHDSGRTWKRIKQSLEPLYDVRSTHLSPHHYDVPHNRGRMYIVASKTPLTHFVWPSRSEEPSPKIVSVLDKRPSDARPLSDQVRRCIGVWQEFLDKYPEQLPFPGYPIWSMEFGADYPFEQTTPHTLGAEALVGYKGIYGQSIRSVEDAQKLLPSYAWAKNDKFPSWKVSYIRRNRELYRVHKEWIDEWIPKILPFPHSQQKLEWNAQNEKRVILELISQIRPSGLRVKRATIAPSLVAMTTTQVPIIGWENRYMTPRECARLQSLEGLKYLPEVPTRAYSALGNAVNARVAGLVAKALFEGVSPDAADINLGLFAHAR